MGSDKARTWYSGHYSRFGTQVREIPGSNPGVRLIFCVSFVAFLANEQDRLLIFWRAIYDVPCLVPSGAPAAGRIAAAVLSSDTGSLVSTCTAACHMSTAYLVSPSLDRMKRGMRLCPYRRGGYCHRYALNAPGEIQSDVSRRACYGSRSCTRRSRHLFSP